MTSHARAQTATARRLVGGLESPPALLSDKEVHRQFERAKFEDINFHLPPALEEVTLSGSQTNAGGAWLEILMASVVDAGSGVIDWLPDDGRCHGELYVHLQGAIAGHSYLGQLRCRCEVAYGQEQTAYVGCNVFGGASGAQYGRLMVQSQSMVIPFFLQKAGAQEAWVAFNPSGLRTWRVYDVFVKREG